MDTIMPAIGAFIYFFPIIILQIFPHILLGAIAIAIFKKFFKQDTFLNKAMTLMVGIMPMAVLYILGLQITPIDLRLKYLIVSLPFVLGIATVYLAVFIFKKIFHNVDSVQKFLNYFSGYAFISFLIVLLLVSIFDYFSHDWNSAMQNKGKCNFVYKISKDICWERFATKEKDYKVCNKIFSEGDNPGTGSAELSEITCYAKVAVAKNDSSICNQLPLVSNNINSSYSTYSRAECIKEMVKILKNGDLCDSLSDMYKNVPSRKANESLSLVEQQLNGCFYRAATSKDDEYYCSRIVKDEKYKQDCIFNASVDDMGRKLH